MDHKGWTEEEINILKEFYIKEDAQQLRKRLPGKTTSQIFNQAFKMGLRKNNRWSESEIDILKMFYGTESIEELQVKLPGRTAYDIKQKASRLGLSDRGDWTKDEIDILTKYYPVEGKEVIKRLPGRSESAIHHAVRRLKIKRYITKEWTPEEDEVLKQYYYKESITNLNKRLPRFSVNDIHKRGRQLGLGIKKVKGANWTKEENDILVQYYGKIPTRELLKKLPNRTYNSITTQASLLKLVKKTNQIKKETSVPDNEEVNKESISEIQLSEVPVLEQTDSIETDDRQVDDLLPPQSTSEEELIRADDQQIKRPKKRKIRKTHRKLKIETNSRRREVWSEDEDNLLRQRYNKEDISILHQKLPGHSLSSIKRRAHHLGIDITKRLTNWKDEEIAILQKYYPIEGTAVIYRLKNHSINSIKAATKVFHIKVERINEPWEVKEDILACKFYLEHVDDWHKKEKIDELLGIFISNGYLKHGHKTIHMKLANCSYIHAGIGLEHASKQNIKVYNKLTGNNFFKRMWKRFSSFIRRVFHVK